MTVYSESQRNIQQQFGTEALADRLELGIFASELNEQNSAFIASRDFFFLSTVDGDGSPTVSYKGGDVGTVAVLDMEHLAFPAYDGNGMFLSMGNIVDTAKIGMLFIDFETPSRVRVQATATFSTDDELLDRYPGAIGIVRASIDQVFANCARYIHTHERVATSQYVPDESGSQPLPSWKRIDLLQDVVGDDTEHAVAEAGGPITGEEYGERLAAGES